MMMIMMVVRMIVIVVVVPIVRMAVIGDRAIEMLHTSIRQMRVIMLMIVECKTGVARTKQTVVILTLAHCGRRTTAADMAV